MHRKCQQPHDVKIRRVDPLFGINDTTDICERESEQKCKRKVVNGVEKKEKVLRFLK